MKAIYDDIMAMQPKYTTFGENLYWCYAARQAMAILYRTGEVVKSRKYYMLRTSFYRRFIEGKQNISDFYDVNKVKMRTKDFCFYCYEEIPSDLLTADHVFPRKKGGSNDMENIIFVCKNCNSSKGKRDLVEWFLCCQDRLPSPFVYGHYLRQVYFYALEHNLMEKPFDEVCAMELPFNPRSILLYSNSKAWEIYANW